MKKYAVATIIVITVAGVASAATIVGSKHDLSAALPTSQQVCVFCHTAHQPTGVTQDPLWNHTPTATGSFGVYASNTLDATPTDIGGTTSASLLCMSCHDGTIGLGSLHNDPNIAAGEETPTNSATAIGGNGNLGTDLTNDHPVNFTYDGALVTADGELNDPTVAPISNWLNGGVMECSSCHDVHDPQFLPFLRATNVDSALCTTCHVK